MSLIVAKKDGNVIAIVSDTKLTYPLEEYPKLEMAPPHLGVIKSVIINSHLCVSFACDDIDVAEIAIRECRENQNNLYKILDYLLRVNIETNNGIEFILCFSHYPLFRIYEIRNFKRIDVPHSWIGSINGYNVFQEKLFEQRSRQNKDKNDLSDLGTAMDEVIKSGKDLTVNGFCITVSNRSGAFEYVSGIKAAFPARNFVIKGSGFIPMTYGTAAEGGYNVHIISSLTRFDVLAIHLLQGNFGIVYTIKKAGLLRPEIINNVDEIEFSEIIKEKYGIRIMGYTSSVQKSYFDRGNRAFEKKVFHKALQYYNLGLQVNENGYKANLYFNKGLTLWILKNFKEAILSFNEAVKLNSALEERVKKIVFGNNLNR